MLGPIIEEICMVELRKNILSRIASYGNVWKRYVDETNFYIKPDSVYYAFLDLFHSNIKEYNNKISFLDVLILWNNSKTQAAVHQKFTNNGVYLQWDLSALDTLKRSTFKYTY